MRTLARVSPTPAPRSPPASLPKSPRAEVQGVTPPAKRAKTSEASKPEEHEWEERARALVIAEARKHCAEPLARVPQDHPQRELLEFGIMHEVAQRKAGAAEWRAWWLELFGPTLRPEHLGAHEQDLIAKYKLTQKHKIESVFKYVGFAQNRARRRVTPFCVKRKIKGGPATNPSALYGDLPAKDIEIEEYFETEMHAVLFMVHLEEELRQCRCRLLYERDAQLPASKCCMYHDGRCHHHSCPGGEHRSGDAVECTWCSREFHLECVNLTQGDARLSGDWYCSELCVKDASRVSK